MVANCPITTERPFQGDYFFDPYETYTLLREAGSAHRIELPNGSPVWLITHYDDVRHGLRDQRLARHRSHSGGDYKGDLFPEAVRTGNLAMEDGEAHARLRRFLTPALTASRVEGFRPRVEEIVDERLDDIEEAGEVDLMTLLAAPVPITVIADIYGIPDEDRTDFRQWTDTMFGSDPEAARDAASSLLQFVDHQIERKRAEPADDLLSYWITTPDDQGRHLQHNQILGMAYFTLIGGYDTTVGMIGTGALALLRHPRHAERFRADADVSHVTGAVEELMRWDGCLQTAIRRFATEDLTLGDARIAAGDTVMLSIGAAARDDRHFPDPDHLDFSRRDKRHLLFGFGPHACPGAGLGRMEVAVSLHKLFTRFPDLALAVPYEEVPFRETFLIRSPLTLPVTVRARG